MNKKRLLARTASGFTTLVALFASAAATAADGAPIAGYLYTLGTGPVAANEVIQLDASAVSNVQTGKELVLALGALQGDQSKDAFGLSFTPGRSKLGALAVSLADYADSKRPFSRLWGNTTFSYAQNKLDQGGTKYKRSAWAVNVSYYLHDDDDPVIAARKAVIVDLAKGKGGACQAPMQEVMAAIRSNQTQLLDLGVEIKRALNGNADRPLPGPVISWLGALANDQTAEVPAEIADVLPTILERKAAIAQALGESSRLVAQAQACAEKAAGAARQKWNASQVMLVVADGSMRSTAADAPRLKLGQWISLALAWAPRDDASNLLNLTYRRIRNELVVDSLAGTPAYKSTNIAAVRYTYGQPGRDTYALAELSNVKTNTGTLSGAAFKQAVGIDHRLADGLWLEFRYGRARTEDGTTIENKALLSFKFSPETTLDRNTSR